MFKFSYMKMNCLTDVFKKILDWVFFIICVKEHKQLPVITFKMKMMLEQPCALYFQLLNFKNFFLKCSVWCYEIYGQGTFAIDWIKFWFRKYKFEVNIDKNLWIV